jgi:hypothetical protein
MLPQKVKKGRKNCSILAPAGKFKHALRLRKIFQKANLAGRLKKCATFRFPTTFN